MTRLSLSRRFFAVSLFALATGACYARVQAGPEECRTVEVRNRHDIEVCRARCNENGCREHCAERERWSREHRCWVE